MIKQQIDIYEITQTAGRGSAATVYIARQQPVERYVALKLFDRLDAPHTDRLRQILAQLLELDHTNLLPVYATGQHGDQLYAVLRYMPAGTLQTKLRASRWRLDDLARVIEQVAAALDYAQQHGLAHGRLTPANIFFDHAGNAFVADLGLTAALDVPLSDYAAPELRRTPTLNVADLACADTYSLGAILGEMLTGQKPIEAAGRDEERINRRVAVPPRPSSLNPKVPPALDAIVLQALAIDPDQRYATPLDLAAALKPPPADRSAVPAPEAGASGVRRVTARRAARQWRGPVLGLIGVLSAIGIVVALASQPTPATPAPIEPATPVVTNVPTRVSTATATVVLPTASVNAPVPATATASATSTPPPSLTPTATATNTPPPTATRTPRRVTATPTNAVSVEPLTLMTSRQSDRATLILTFRTFVRPAEGGPIGSLGLTAPEIEPNLTEPILAQVGSGEQVLRAGVIVDCRRVVEPLLTREVILTLRDEAGRVLLTQTFEYIKRWCN